MARRPAPVRVRVRALGVWDHLARQNLSQNDLGRRIGITSGYFSQLINGVRFPSPELRRLLLEALPSTTFEELFIVERRQPSGDYVPIEHLSFALLEREAAKACGQTTEEVSAW